jgi:tRNA-dihydrouridine synthase A
MKIFLAPMVGRTDKYFRKLVRIISPNVILFTEMITVDSLIRGNFRNYTVNKSEHPLIAQIAGNDSKKFVECAEILTKSGFDEINLNIGCPSAKVVKGGFGACQIINPHKVSEFVESIKSCTNLPISIKTRLGLGFDQNLDDIKKFIRLTSEAGCKTYYIHARNAILDGLSTRKNRSVPPLRYDDVMKLKRTFPDLKIYINGGIVNMDVMSELLTIYGGVMLGRKIYDDPMFLNDIEKKIFSSNRNLSTHKVICKYIDQLDVEDQHNKLYALKHLTNLYKGTCYAKKWRKFLHLVINSNQPLQNIKNFNYKSKNEERKINCS